MSASRVRRGGGRSLTEVSARRSGGAILPRVLQGSHSRSTASVSTLHRVNAEAVLQHSRSARVARGHRVATLLALWLVGGGNAAVIVWLWLHGGGIGKVHTGGELLTSLGRITGLLGAYLALIQEEHRRIHDAIAQGDPKAAREAMRRHLTRSLERYRKLAAEQKQAA